MSPETVTIDTNLWIDFLNENGSYQDMELLLRWHEGGKVKLYYSTRVFDPDAWRMDRAQVARLRAVLNQYGVEALSAPFRLNVSRLSGRDTLNGGPTSRSPDQTKRFRCPVGKDPTQLNPASVGKRLMNKIGDYDSLSSHFHRGLDVFLTLEKGDIFLRREDYKQELGLIIQDPGSFIQERLCPA